MKALGKRSTAIIDDQPKLIPLFLPHLLGSGTFDVLDIDTSNLFFAGLKVRMRGKKGPLCHGEDSNGDEFFDLVCQFEDDPSMWTPDSSAEATLTGTANGSDFEGTDSICVTQ